ncbi:general stress protein [Peribacillus deserti]|uniref:General stress protein n=1 Tax=Peribacillus deserti TaxID=673318 RepID=A0A2N5MAC6_9BACI|nr:general stress protein [Peribacillus deserti]PLT31287.1 general stress protein [Peribacillus deserti]
MDKRVIGVYEKEEQAQAAVKELQNRGYSIDEISIVAKNIDGLGLDADQVKSKETDGLVAGAAAGGAVGLTGLFLGLSYLAIPGIGPILAAGPIFTILGGAVAGLATNSGGLSKALQEIGLNEEEARTYEDDINKGKILIAVTD